MCIHTCPHRSLLSWRLRDSNSRPPACKAGALPAELSPHKSGSHLLSHAVSSIVPSAAYGLTIVFEMGTGVSRKRIATRILVVSLLRPCVESPHSRYPSDSSRSVIRHMPESIYFQLPVQARHLLLYVFRRMDSLDNRFAPWQINSNTTPTFSLERR